MTSIANAKAESWNRLGGAFWRLGRTSAKPSAQAIARFLEGADAGTPLCVVGASTKGLIEEAIARALRVTVIDFSNVMCADLAAEVSSPLLHCRCADILDPPAEEIAGAFSFVVADRLINRMVHADCPRLLTHVARMLRPNGVARLSVKIGWYAMDHRLLAEGRRRGTLERFFDARTRTIDYASAAAELAAIEIEHGQIPRDVLLPWYVGRGRESRFEIADLEWAVSEAQALGSGLALERIDDLPEADSSVLMTLHRY